MFDYDVLNIRRQELLHHRWTERVYNPIRSRVLSRLNSKDNENMRLYKHLLYNDFLTKTNRKVFVDVLTTEGALGVFLKLQFQSFSLTDQFSVVTTGYR